MKVSQTFLVYSFSVILIILDESNSQVFAAITPKFQTFTAITPQKIVVGCRTTIGARNGQSPTTSFYIIDVTGRKKYIEPGQTINAIFPQFIQDAPVSEMFDEQSESEMQSSTLEQQHFVKRVRFPDICFPSECGSDYCGSTIGPLSYVLGDTKPINVVGQEGNDGISTSLQSSSYPNKGKPSGCAGTGNVAPVDSGCHSNPGSSQPSSGSGCNDAEPPKPQKPVPSGDCNGGGGSSNGNAGEYSPGSSNEHTPSNGNGGCNTCNCCHLCSSNSKSQFGFGSGMNSFSSETSASTFTPATSSWSVYKDFLQGSKSLKTRRTDASYYASLPGAITGSAKVIYYPSCERDAYVQPAIINYCPSFEDPSSSPIKAKRQIEVEQLSAGVDQQKQ